MILNESTNIIGAVRLFFICIISLSLSGCPTNESPSGNTVTMAGNVFNPSNLTVSVNTQVTWMNDSGAPHTVASDTPETELSSGNINPTMNFVHTFTSAGTYLYHCEIHAMMTGTVTVTP